MTHTELWLTYQFASRAHLKAPSTTQLIELEFQNQKLCNLEDVLDYVFSQGFVEAKHRSSTWWEKKDGQKVRTSHPVEDLLQQGVGKQPEDALKLIIEDVPTALWFSYVYLHNPSGHVVTQRVRLTTLSCKLERLAHVTNHIFDQGYLAPKYRPVVHWQGACGKRFEEHVCVDEVLSWGEGLCEDKPLRLIIDSKPLVGCYGRCGCC